MHITIREGMKDDAAAIADLSRKTFYETFAPDNNKADMDKFMNEQFTKEALMEEVGAPGNTFFVALVNDEMVGYARLRENTDSLLGDKDAIEVARIYADKKMIDKGVGRKLMEACIDHAISINKDVMWLGVWEKNPVAINFYHKFGFEKFSEHDFVVGTDVQIDWLMKKELH